MSKYQKKITVEQCMSYEIQGGIFISFFARRSDSEFFQNIFAKYLAWKVNSKHGRYLKSIALAELIIKGD